MAARRAKRSRGRRGKGLAGYIWSSGNNQLSSQPSNLRGRAHGRAHTGTHRWKQHVLVGKCLRDFLSFKHRIYIGKAMLLETATRGGWVRGIAEIRATLDYLSTGTAEKEHPCRCGGPTSRRLLQEGPATCPA